MQFCLDGQEFPLRQGDIVLVPQGAQHSFYNDTDQTVGYYEIKFTVLSRALAKLLPDAQMYLPDDRFSAALVEHIAQEYLHSRTLCDESTEAALETLVFHLTSQERLISQRQPDVIDTTGYTPLARRVVEYLSEHFNRPITLDDVSAGVGISKNYLCNAFKRVTGVTILDCLNMIRIRKAAELIVYSDLTLNQVAEMCGYVSGSHFNRVFARYVGIPPGQCRRAFSVDLLSKQEQSRIHPNSFIYSVLAGKTITPTTCNAFDEFPEEK